MPWMGVPPKGQGSIAGKTHRLTELLADRYSFAVVSGATGRVPEKEHPRIRYIPIDEKLDRRYLDRLIGGYTRLIGRGTHPFYQPHYHPLYIRRAARTLREFGCSTVVVHEFPQWLPLLRRQLPKARLVLWGGADSFIEADELLPMVGEADLLIGASRGLAARFIERAPALADRTHVVYSGIDVGTFAPGQGQRRSNRLLYAGRVTPEKGVHVLVDAFRRAAEDRPDLELVLAGPLWISDPSLFTRSVPHHLEEVSALAAADYRAELLRRAGRHAARISFPGPLDRDQLRQELQTCSIFVHPALCNEGFAQGVVEALACGAPVVVSDLGGPQEYLTDGANGCIVPAGDDEALAHVLTGLLDDPERRTALGVAARALAEQQLSAEAAADVLATVLDGRATPFDLAWSRP